MSHVHARRVSLWEGPLESSVRRKQHHTRLHARTHTRVHARMHACMHDAYMHLTVGALHATEAAAASVAAHALMLLHTKHLRDQRARLTHGRRRAALPVQPVPCTLRRRAAAPSGPPSARDRHLGRQGTRTAISALGDCALGGEIAWELRDDLRAWRRGGLRHRR